MFLSLQLERSRLSLTSPHLFKPRELRQQFYRSNTTSDLTSVHCSEMSARRQPSNRQSDRRRKGSARTGHQRKSSNNNNRVQSGKLVTFFGSEEGVARRDYTRYSAGAAHTSPVNYGCVFAGDFMKKFSFHTLSPRADIGWKTHRSCNLDRLIKIDPTLFDPLFCYVPKKVRRFCYFTVAHQQRLLEHCLNAHQLKKIIK